MPITNFPPSEKDQARIDKYAKNELIFLGRHYDAFNLSAEAWMKEYPRLQYVTTNFGGMLSKLSADLLFEEFPKITLPKGDVDYLHSLFVHNKLRTQFYESGLENSYRGDAIFRQRAEDGQHIIEDLNPTAYFPEYDSDNVRAEPTVKNLIWHVRIAGQGDKSGIFVEAHHKGYYENLLYIIDNEGKILSELDAEQYLGLPRVVETGIDRFLVTHVKNYGINSSHFGLSDYDDLLSLMYAINKRMTKNDIILDKHGEPILAVPTGVLDEKGNVKREAFGVIEVDSTEGGGQVPQYIVWDAKLESAFTEIEKLVEFLFMTSETSFTAFGMDKGGVAESGRAMKYKLMRTLAKKHRKELYYTDGLREMLMTAQEFAKVNKLKAGSESFSGEIVIPEIKWQDGIVTDAIEQIEVEERRLDAGLTTTKDSIMRLDDISEEEAQAKQAEIEKERKARQPNFNTAPIVPGNKNE